MASHEIDGTTIQHRAGPMATMVPGKGMANLESRTYIQGQLKVLS